ncbi:MAG: hypothetical protein ACJAW1_001826 [Glaciecola sp.]
MLIAASPVLAADSFYSALSSGKASGDFNLRYENVSQNNVLDDASALTLRTRLGYTTGTLSGWSVKLEIEDNRIVLGQGDYSLGATNYNPGQYSTIADPEFTELDQAFVQYKSENLHFKLGRQVIALDGHRFVGHVGWRQDRQTFDAATVGYKLSDDFTFKYSFISKRNRIFGEARDIDSNDHLLNAKYQTQLGALTAYSYLLEIDNETDNALNTYGVSFARSTKSGQPTGFSWIYGLEYATQDVEFGPQNFSADYYFAEIGLKYKGYTIKIAQETLASDNGAYGFSTPLATLHKFNGWADQFLSTPAQGLVDQIATVAGKLGKGNFVASYHNYSADQASDTIDDLGSEVNFQYTQTVTKHYKVGIKVARYLGNSGRVDADKIWLWVSTKF